MSTQTKELTRFKTLWGNRGHQLAGNNTGTQFDNEYNYVIKENLIVGLEKTGEVNRYEAIQLHADECKIETILAKAAVDPTILQQRKGQFLDTTNMPKSLAEFKNLEIKVIQDFEKLPVEIRAKFDHSFDKYISEYGSEKWAEALGLKTEEDVKEAIKDVKEEIQEQTEEKGDVNNE